MGQEADRVDSNQDIDALIALLDGCVQAGDSRIKIDVVEGQGGQAVPPWPLRHRKSLGLWNGL